MKIFIFFKSLWTVLHFCSTVDLKIYKKKIEIFFYIFFCKFHTIVLGKCSTVVWKHHTKKKYKKYLLKSAVACMFLCSTALIDCYIPLFFIKPVISNEKKFHTTVQKGDINCSTQLYKTVTYIMHEKPLNKKTKLQ